jgi:hypothetical protein
MFISITPMYNECVCNNNSNFDFKNIDFIWSFKPMACFLKQQLFSSFNISIKTDLSWVPMLQNKLLKFIAR